MGHKPLWVWLPDQGEPTLAGEVAESGSGYAVRYLPEYLRSGIPIDPLCLRLQSGVFEGSVLPGVILDAKPSGFGQDCITAAHHDLLTDLDLLEAGAPDGVGAIVVCDDISRKLDWQAPTLDRLIEAIRELKDGAPASKAMRMISGNMATSAGGERPKVTVTAEGRLWLAKTQDKAERFGMPALEFVAMRLARQCGITVPAVQLITVNSHQVYLVERFDRHGESQNPCRRLYASANTVLRLRPSGPRTEPRRSYLDFGYEARRWSNLSDVKHDDRGELCRRMVFNALVGNTDDHPHNHGLLLVDGVWRLSPAFDITPIRGMTGATAAPWPLLSMGVCLNGSRQASPHHLLMSASVLGVDLETGTEYLVQTAKHISSHWESLLRYALVY
jgi:serine/threonine-protein kinase HipA